MPISRKKACIRCRMAKARCSLTNPQCSRCTGRGLVCEYADQPQSRLGPYTRSADNEDTINTATITDAIGTEVQLSPADFSAPSRDPWLGNWDEINFGSQLASLLTPNTMFSDNSLAFVPLNDQLSANEAVQDALSPASNTRIAKRAPSTAHEFFALKVMLGQVESYPKMMIEGNSLPPFIHSKCALDDTGSFECRERHTCLSEHLSICASLVHLFYTKTPRNSDFVWKTIYEEQKRIHREYPTYSNETLLEAMQAICIYVILQAEDQESQQKNDPQALLETMGALGSRVHLTSGYDDQDPAHPLDRRKWALLESTRRTICLLYIIETLLNVIIAREDPANCQGFGRMPLPCSRNLWEIKSTSQWAKNYREALAKRKSRRVVNIVDLQRSMRLPTSQLCNHEEDESVLNDIMTWCEGLDQFGTLIWMASTVSKCA